MPWLAPCIGASGAFISFFATYVILSPACLNLVVVVMTVDVLVFMSSL